MRTTTNLKKADDDENERKREWERNAEKENTKIGSESGI